MDFDQGKLFVGGISWGTSEDTLKDHFSKYGDVVESVIVRDRNTGSSRGFGFLLFSDPSAADKALQDKHTILGRTVEVKKAVTRDEHHQNHHKQHQNHYPHPYQQQNNGSGKNSSNGDINNQFRTKKIFVGGLSANLTEVEFKSYFEKFGRITDVVVMYDSVTHRPRGFGFITFDSEESVEDVMQKTFHELNDKTVEVKRAVPKDGNNGTNNNNYNSCNNMRVGGGRGSLVGSYQGGFYPGYVFTPFTCYGNVRGYPYGVNPYGGYPICGYGGMGYGTAPIGVVSSPSNDPVGSVPYNNAAIYSGFVNVGVGGFMEMPPRGYHESQGVGDEPQMHPGTITSEVDKGTLDYDTSDFAASVKKNESGPDEQFKSGPVGNSD